MGDLGGLYGGLVGQETAVGSLIAAAVRPVHAYLFVGPPGVGKAAAATSFAAALLCPARAATPPSGPDGTCETCLRTLAGTHPDVINVEREGPYITIGVAQQVTQLASTSPLEGDRKILILHDFHLVQAAGPALLKTIEEPPASTIFIILAEHVPPELITIASRCVQVNFDALTPAQVAAALEADGIGPVRAAEVAAASGGRLDRARLLVTDSGLEARRSAWRAIPARLDGTGATVTVLVDELLGWLESSVLPLRARHDSERGALEERNAKAALVTGKGTGRAAKAMLSAGVGEMEERQKREVRRHRTDELRAGLATLAAAYRDRLVDGVEPRGTGPDPDAIEGIGRARSAGGGGVARRRQGAMTAIRHIDKFGRDLIYNGGEALQLQALLTRLGRHEQW